MNSSLSSVNALGTLLLLLGLVFCSNSVTAWQSSQYAYSRLSFEERESNVGLMQQEYRQALIRQALYIGSAIFLMLLGVQILLKRRWACHFFFSIRQLSQLSLLLIPLSTLLLLLNRPLIDSLVEIYQPLVKEVMQQQYTGAAQAVILNDEAMRMVIQVAFWTVALLGMAIAGLVLRLSGRCLRPEVQEALLEREPQPSRLSYFVLCLPVELLLVLLLSVYGTANQLLMLVSIFVSGIAWGPLLLHLAAFIGFAQALLQLTNRNMQQGEAQLKFQLLKKSLRFCGLAYLLQLLQNILQPLWVQGEPNSGPTDLAVVKLAVSQIDGLSDTMVLLMLAMLYYLLWRAQTHSSTAPPPTVGEDNSGDQKN